MLFLLAMHLVIPSVEYPPFYPFPGLSWFGFDWYPNKGLVVFVQYAFFGVSAFVFIGLTTLLPLILIILLLFRPKQCRQERSIAMLLVALVLLAVYLDGWFLYTWPLPYRPVQTFFIGIFALVAQKNWRLELLRRGRETSDKSRLSV